MACKPTNSITALSIVALATLAAVNTASAQSPAGTWELYPAQAASYAISPQQPINADGTSNFKNTGKSVIPVKFELSRSTGPVLFQSIFESPNTNTDNDYSFLSFTPASTLLFNQITNLSSVYNFIEGNCHGGSLRWSVRLSATEAIFIYYGAYPNFTDCTTVSQSGLNLISFGDLRFDTSQLVGGTFYDTYAHAIVLAGARPVVRVSLVLDSGWAGNQRLTPTNVTVNSNTFVPAASGQVKTCVLPPAEIQISKTSGVATGPVNEPISIQPGASDDAFRIVDCKYMYNLATSSLSGVGRYKVEALINGTTPAAGSADFDLR